MQSLRLNIFDRFLVVVLKFIVGFYRVAMAPSLGGACRFEPSCSEYAQLCLSQHHPRTASALILRRLLKCRPGGAFGFDFVPKPVEKGVRKSVGDQFS